VRESTQNGTNMFTDSHVVMAVAMVVSAARLGEWDGALPLNGPVLGPVTRAASRVWDEISSNLAQWRGGRIHPDDENHDFVTFHAIRAGDAFGFVQSQPPAWDDDLTTRVRNSVLLQLGGHTAGITSQFDPAELAFSVALLQRFGAPDHQPMTQRALQVISDEQAADGAWPTSRLVSYGNSYLLFPASFEVALTMAEILIRQLDRGDQSGVELLLDILGKAFRLVVDTFMSVGGRSGWSNDRVRSPGRLESWSTAIVLSFLVRYREALMQVRQAQVLAKYEVALPSQSSFEWPDLAPFLGVQSRSDLRALDSVSDPTDEGNLREALTEQFVTPVRRSPVQRPQAVSLLLPGPPGTRKTSLVRRLAQALGWPLLTLTPPDFFGAGGLELFEATAAGVFRDLMRLRRVVVLFDECEDFFRKRDPAISSGDRTMGAFITAGMLPRLQRLHERGWIIFVLATNALLSELDPAVVRPGRFDFQQEMWNPPLRAQRRYVEPRVRDPDRLRLLDEALVDWAGRSQSRSPEDHEVTFVVLDKLVEHANSEESIDADTLKLRVAELTRSGPPPLVS
jgi:hypothetical protein